MGDSSLDDLRKTIDAIDKQLITLLNERAATALQIGKAKSELNKQAYDPMRERAVLDKINALNKGPLSKGALEDVYATIITACRELQIGQR